MPTYGYSLADIEDILVDNSHTGPQTMNLHKPDDTEYNDYRRLGTFVNYDAAKKFLQRILQEAYIQMGHGLYTNTLQNFLSRLDRHGTAMVPLNSMNPGFTFITRPRLNMTMANLRQHPVTASLASEDENSVSFMIRALLDTRMSRGQPVFAGSFSTHQTTTDEEIVFADKAGKSGLVDVLTPFFIPLCNGLKGISGFPDFTIHEETTEGDFHSGDFTFAKGSDMNNRTQELSLEFRDAQGSPILASIFYWALVMALQAKGVMMAYPDDIYEQRLNYTVSIYRFITDHTRTHILWWCKATGCFPKSAPVGALFNVQQGEDVVSSAMNFSVPFIANDVKVNHPGHLLQFNRLMRDYCPHITDQNKFPDVPYETQYNFNSLPYIETDNAGLVLKWKTNNYYNDMNTLGTLDAAWDELVQAQKDEMRLLNTATNVAGNVPSYART